MSNITSQKQYIQIEAARTRQPVGESLVQGLGGAVNFTEDGLVFEHAFKMNGSVRGFSGKNGVDGLFVFPYNAEIIDVIIYGEVQGSSGTSEYDIKYSSATGVSFATIFTTTPKLTSTSPSYTTASIGSSITGTTAAVLTSTPFQVVAGGRIRMDVISMMGGSPSNSGIIIKYRPR